MPGKHYAPLVIPGLPRNPPDYKTPYKECFLTGFRACPRMELGGGQARNDNAKSAALFMSLCVFEIRRLNIKRGVTTHPPLVFPALLLVRHSCEGRNPVTNIVAAGDTL